MRGAGLLLLLLTGCPKAPGGKVPTLAAAELFVPGRFDYEELTSVEGEVPVSRDTVTEVWEAAPDLTPPEGYPGTVYRVDEFRTGQPPTGTLWVSGERGLGYFASVGPTGQVVTYATKLALPATVRTGETWEGVHGEGAGENTRTCHVEPTPYCPDTGAAVACETHWKSGGAVWMRQHYCKDVGWVGYEALSVRGGITTRTWSEEATLDGKPLPLVGMEQRPFPEIVVR
ncbi:MAG: hypothetical protein H6738_17745 [Alphaproteobacteria bacterium]|nr:hypothetical protein [Alphaproteobacteria bacterium]MCB9695118.1 hypothetical protein [Alphaproteobacteria bacterium]MCB9698629.1 hypothetical protein [Alphaproteobacteria bacterium]